MQTIVSMTSAEASPGTFSNPSATDEDEDGSLKDLDDGMENFVAQSMSAAVMEEMSSAP